MGLTFETHFNDVIHHPVQLLAGAFLYHHSFGYHILTNIYLYIDIDNLKQIRIQSVSQFLMKISFLSSQEIANKLMKQ